jgi:hypothetical protein
MIEILGGFGQNMRNDLPTDTRKDQIRSLFS